MEGTFIGMNSDALDGDPNGSSAVINNAYPFGGTISLGEKFVIPGTSFYMFDLLGKRYQTAESISVKAGEYFQVYIMEDNGSEPYYLTTDEFYYLYEGGIEDKTAWFDAHYSDALNSNVSVKSDEYYILGVGVVMLDGSMVLLSSYNNDQNLNNYYDYSNVSESILHEVFESKTRYYGTNGLTVSDLTDDEYGINDKSRYSN